MSAINRQRQQGPKRRFKTGQWVQYDGLYSDDWGVDLLLMEGDLFPAHPQMGDTSWTYVNVPFTHYAKSKRLNGHFIGY